MNQRMNISGVGVSAINMEMALDWIKSVICEGRRSYIVVCAVSTVLACLDMPSVRRAVNRAGLVTPDGMPIVWLLRCAGFRHARRVYGPDLMVACCECGLSLGWRHYFYGGAAGVPELVAENLQRRFPGLQVAGTYSPPFRSLTPAECSEIVARINSTAPDIVWVGLGSPKQDLWMAEQRARLDAPLLIGVGAAFDFHAGIKKQAPRWMQRLGLEWFFRLLLEPRRLWRRYLLGNPRFVWNLFLQYTGLRQFPLEDD